jgi:hypothetical protein
MLGTGAGIDQTVRSTRTLHSVFMVTVLLYVYMMHVVQRTPAALDPVLSWPIAGLAVFAWCAAYSLRLRRLSPIASRLQTAPDDASAIAKWRSYSIVSVAILESIVLFGFALYMMGGTTTQVAPFIVIPFATMPFWFPKHP